MADKKITDFDASVALDDTDLIAIVEDVATTPVTKKATWTLIKSFLKTYFDTLYSTAVKATGAELDTGTDDAKFATAKALADSGYFRDDETATLTNKTLISTTNVIEEITTTASSATPTPTGGSLRNFFTVTALAANATFAAPSGTPADGNNLIIRIKDNDTARDLAWNPIYRAIGVTLPTTTVISKTLYVGCRYNSSDTKWDVLAVGQEA